MMMRGTPESDRLTRRVAYGTGGFALALNAMMQFALPLRAVELGIELPSLGLLLGAKGVTEAIVAVPLGRVLDKVGVRAAFTAGTGAAALIVLGYSVASSFAVLLLLQIGLGMSRPLAWLGAQHYVSGMRTGAEQAHDTGRLSFVANVGQIVGPLLVGLAASLVGLTSAFYLLALYCSLFFFLGLVLPAAAARKTTAKAPAAGAWPDSGLRATMGILAMPRMQVALLLSSARLWITNVWMAFFPVYLVYEAQVSEAVAGTVASSMALTATGISLSTGKLSKLGRAEIVTATALGIAALGVAVGPFLGGYPMAYLSALLVGIGHGVSLPMLIMIVSNAAPKDQRGLALGVRTTVNQAAATLAPTTVAPLIAVAGFAIGFPLAGGVAATAVLGAVLRDFRANRATNPS